MTETITLPREVAKRILRNIEIGNKLSAGIEMRREIEAALEQPQVNSPEIPEGWKLVPVKPTEDMLNAVAWPGCAATDWEHMLAAAPQPPTAEKSSGVEQPQGEQEPLFWYRPRRDGLYEGPLHKSQIERVRKESGGWVPLYTRPQPKRQPLDTDTWPECPAPSVRPVYATSANTKSVRDGFEVGGYEKTPPLFTKSQLYDYALNVLRAHGIGGET